MAANIPFWRGEHVTLKLYQDGNPVYIAGKRWRISQNAAEIAEGVNGEKRDRLDLVTNYYEGEVDIFQSDQEAMTMFIDWQTNEDAVALPLAQQAAVRIQHRDGTRASYRLLNAKFGPWTEDMSGRPDPVMMTIKFRFTEWKPVQTI